jgi:phage terminase Nu1 subunit (DNA packaging protein)
MKGINQRLSQASFGELVGVSQPAVSAMLAAGWLPANGTGRQWLLAYCAHLREVAAGRASSGDLDLAQERAALAKEQRIGQKIKNAVAQGEYAPVGLLGDVLAAASAAVVDRFDALPATLKKACPDLPAEARDAIDRVLSAARNEWIRQTAELAIARMDELADVTEPSDIANEIRSDE